MRALLSSPDSNVLPGRASRWRREVRTALPAALLLLAFRYSSAESQELSPVPAKPSSHRDAVERGTAGIPSFSERFANRKNDDWRHQDSTEISAGAFTANAQVEKKKASRKTYVLRGALIGGVVTAVAAAIGASGSLMSPFALAPAVLGGALIGGLIGALVHGG